MYIVIPVQPLNKTKIRVTSNQQKIQVHENHHVPNNIKTNKAMTGSASRGLNVPPLMRRSTLCTAHFRSLLVEGIFGAAIVSTAIMHYPRGELEFFATCLYCTFVTQTLKSYEEKQKQSYFSFSMLIFLL